MVITNMIPGGQSGVGGCCGDSHGGGWAGQSQKGDGLHPQQAGEGHGAVWSAQHMSWGQRAHSGQDDGICYWASPGGNEVLGQVDADGCSCYGDVAVGRPVQLAADLDLSSRHLPDLVDLSALTTNDRADQLQKKDRGNHLGCWYVFNVKTCQVSQVLEGDTREEKEKKNVVRELTGGKERKSPEEKIGQQGSSLYVIMVKALKTLSVEPVMVMILSGQDPSEMLTRALLCVDRELKSHEQRQDNTLTSGPFSPVTPPPASSGVKAQPCQPAARADCQPQGPREGYQAPELLAAPGTSSASLQREGQQLCSLQPLHLHTGAQGACALRRRERHTQRERERERERCRRRPPRSTLITINGGSGRPVCAVTPSCPHRTSAGSAARLVLRVAPQIDTFRLTQENELT
ncbi:hypothetical protein INR49_013350 [Caranx melampygus]|nr:hypothetical protein INR49_013350 [Caranx melampygus]